MLHSLKLLLPAIIPSWNFFDIIVPSPRIYFATLSLDKKPITDWQEFRPRPAHVSFIRMLGRMFWNRNWNESLFLMSCAERLIEFPTTHSEDEILKRIAVELADSKEVKNTYLQFRLKTIARKDDSLIENWVYESRPVLLDEINTV